MAANSTCSCGFSPCICKNCSAPECKEYGEWICQLCKTCPEHCKCVKCEKCLELFDKNNVCLLCISCNGCCKCVKCTTCGQRSNREQTCTMCHSCRECCLCKAVANSGLQVGNGNGRDIPYFWNPLNNGYKIKEKTPDITPHSKADRFDFKYNRYVSAEIEVASSDRKKAAEIMHVIKALKCKVVRDGSLPETGYEINTSPAFGSTFVNQILHLCDVLKSADAQIVDRCGLHIHVDARDFNWIPNMKNFLRVYHKTENALWQIVSPSRKLSKFSKPCAESFYEIFSGSHELATFKTKFSRVIYGDGNAIDSFRTQKRVESRYNAMNLHSWLFHMTLEFRHHQGSLNAEKIINWAMLCCAVVEFAKTNTESQILIKFKKLSNLDALLTIINDNPLLVKWVNDRVEHFKKSTTEDDKIYYEELKTA